jgi:hypothetical protein
MLNPALATRKPAAIAPSRGTKKVFCVAELSGDCAAANRTAKHAAATPFAIVPFTV